MSEQNLKANQLIVRLKDALKRKDTEALKKLYEKAKAIDWDDVSDYLFNEYDNLVDKANELILN
jgi:hypothetical protein